MTTLIERAQVLIGKKIVAEGWQRDNGGGISGVITKIEQGTYRIDIYVEKNDDASMDYMSFHESHLEILLRDGELPKANRLLNSGTNAVIVATEDSFERNEYGDEFVASCNVCGNDFNELSDEGICGSCCK